MLGKWQPTFAVTKSVHNFLKEKSWLKNPGDSDKLKDINSLMKEYSRRKHLLYTVGFCWCPVVWNCNNCLINKHPENIYYTNYYINFASCCHGHYMFCTASRSGELFLWNLTYNKKSPEKHELRVSYVHSSQTEWPFSLAWTQVSSKDGKKLLIPDWYLVFYFPIYHLNIKLRSSPFQLAKD